MCTCRGMDVFLGGVWKLRRIALHAVVLVVIVYANLSPPAHAHGLDFTLKMSPVVFVRSLCGAVFKTVELPCRLQPHARPKRSMLNAV